MQNIFLMVIKKNPEYAFSCIKTAFDEGARWIVLCDTNGGTLPNEVGEIVLEVSKLSLSISNFESPY